MAKKIRKLLSIVMVLSVLVCVFPLQAFAAEEDGTTVKTEDGVTITTTQATTSSTDGDKTTVTVKVEKTSEGTKESTGEKITGTETTVTSTTTDAEGNALGSSWSVDGYEKKEWTEEDTGDKAGQPEVSVSLKPGQTNVGTSSETTVEGDTTTTVTDRTVTAETSEVKKEVSDSTPEIYEDSDTVLVGPAPVYDENDNEVRGSNGKIKDTAGKDGLFDRNYLSIKTEYSDPSTWADMPADAEFRYVGTGEHSKYFVGFAKVIYKKDADGNTMYDEDGNPIIEKLVNSVNGSDLTSGGEVLDKIVPEYEIDAGFSSSRAQNFMLMDKNGNKVFAYCCDAQTGAVQGKWYSVSNLEDCTYYTSEAEDRIRSIAMNGYWGTSDMPKEDGSYALGSLEGIKANMIKAIENGEIERYVQVPVRDTSTDGAGKIQVDEDGNPIYYEEKMDLLEIISGMTEGEALLATQAAIWSFANGSYGATSGIDGDVVITPDWYRNHQIDYSKHEKEPLDDAAGARVAALYNWLMNLTPTEQNTVVINDKNFVEDIVLSVGDKVADHANNQDDNKDNDVYNTALNFKLAFIPGENDDLLVQISYIDIDGNPVNIIRRLAGENSGDQSYETIIPEADGSYILKGLQLSENEDWGFDLRLEGTQYLEHGVYVYEAVGGRDVSQTFVGVAEGVRNVDVSMGVTIKFDVDENNHVVAERKWHNEDDPVNTPDVPEEEERTPPTNYRVTIEGDGLEEIIDEPVPLAAAPKTGDNSALWILLIMVAGFGIAALNIFGKKRNTSF